MGDAIMAFAEAPGKFLLIQHSGDPSHENYEIASACVERCFEHFSQRSPLCLDKLPDAFDREMDYVFDLDGDGVMNLLVGVCVAFSFEGKIYMGPIAWRSDFDPTIADYVAKYALKDATKYKYTLQ